MIIKLPSVVFSIEQEISADNSNTDGDYNQNQNDEEHEAVHVIDLVGPKRSKNEIPKAIQEFWLAR